MKTFVSSAEGRHEPLEPEEKNVASRAEPAEVPAVKNKGGRPKGSGLKLTPELQERFCAAVAGGMFLGRAAKLCGISRDAFEVWRAKGEKGIEPYKSFVAAYEKAEVECEAFLLKCVKDAAPSDFRAALAILKSRHPTNWSDHAQRLAVFGPEGDAGVGGNLGAGFNIFLHLGIYADPKPAIPAVGDDDARAIELTAPATKV